MLYSYGLLASSKKKRKLILQLCLCPLISIRVTIFESQSSRNIQKSLMCPKIIVENFYEQPKAGHFVIISFIMLLQCM